MSIGAEIINMAYFCIIRSWQGVVQLCNLCFTHLCVLKKIMTAKWAVVLNCEVCAYKLMLLGVQQ